MHACRVHPIVAVTVCLLASSLCAQDLSGKVVGVSDGDTITVLQDTGPIGVHLNG